MLVKDQMVGGNGQLDRKLENETQVGHMMIDNRDNLQIMTELECTESKISAYPNVSSAERTTY